MKIKKIFAGMSAAAIAMSMMAVSASAAEEAEESASATGAVTGSAKNGYFTMNGTADETKMAVVHLSAIKPENSSATIKNITMKLSAVKAPEAGWVGGGGAIGFNTDADGTGWKQIDTAHCFENDGRKVTGKDDKGNDTYDRDLTIEDCTWTESWDFTDLEPIDWANLEEGSNPIMQFGWWWGAGDDLEVQQWTVTYTDGTTYDLVAEDGLYSSDIDVAEIDKDGKEVKKIMFLEYEGKATREKAAADALEKLTKAVEGATFDEVVDKMNGAAEGLNNAAAVLEEADKAATQVKELEATLADAKAAFDALVAGADEADTETFEAAKAAVESASKDLADAKKALEEAMAAYDEATAAQIAAKDKEIDKLTADKEAAEKELADLKKDADANAAKIAELEKQIADKDAEIAKLKDEKKDLQKQLKEALANAGNGGNGGEGGAGGSSASPKTGAAALGLGAIALAGAAIVVSKKKD